MFLDLLVLNNMGKKKTTEEFVSEAIKIHGNKFDYSKTNYINMRTPVIVTCPFHGDFKIKPGKHIGRKQGCPDCSGRFNWSFKTFYEKLQEKLPHYLDNIDIVNYSEISGLNEKDFKIEKTVIILKCKIDGYVWKSCGKRMLSNQGCRKCSGSLKKTKEEFVDNVNSKSPQMLKKYTIVGEYKDTRTLVSIKCNKCGYEFQTSPYYLINGKTKCPNCEEGCVNKHTHYSVSEKIKDTNWVLLDNVDEHKPDTKFHFQCKKCGYIIETTLGVIIANGYYCPNCDDNARTHTRTYYESKLIEKFDLHNVVFQWDDNDVKVNNRTKFKIIDNNDKLLYYGSYANGIQRDILGFNRKTIQENIDIAIHNLQRKNIILISDIKNISSIRDTVKVKCNECGYEWEIKFSSLIYNSFGCRKCQYANQSLTNSSFLLDEKLSLLENTDLEYMSDHQLIELIGQDVLPREFKVLIKSEGCSKERKNDIKKLREFLSDKSKSDKDIDYEYIKDIDRIDHLEKTFENFEYVNEESTEIEKYTLPELIAQELKIYDKFIVSYGEKNAYISKESINKIWNCVLADNNYIDIVKAMRVDSGKWLSYIIDTFLEEYEQVNKERVTEDYKFEYEPSLMQKLMSYRIATNPYYGNWCGTGAGKTNAFLIASRRIDARVTICICPNSVIGTIVKSIIKVYPNSNIVVIKSINDIISYNREQYNYILFNYEKFSQSYSNEMIKKLISLNKIDFICFDEVHRTKNNKSFTNQNLTNLRILANDKNKDLKVLGMTATPLINNLDEVRNILELITGTSFAEIIKDNACTINNIHNAYKYLTLYGFRYVPDYNIVCKEEKIKIFSDSLTNQLINFKNKDVNDIEGLFIHCKYNNIRQYITNKTIIYTQFIKKIIPNIKKELKEDGITFREYTGEISSEEREQIITDFGYHKFDVILASSPITTGVDGLQKYCDNIIVLSLPWTNAEYTQLIGRINRQGSDFKKVSIIIPQVFVQLKDGKLWSWDEMRFNIIKTKRTLSDAVVDGRISSVFNMNRKKLLNEAIQSLKNGVSDFCVVREKLETDYSIDVSKREYKKSVICDIHQKANTSSSMHMNEYFKMNPNKWREYHIIREENKKEWVEDPINVIADKLNKNNYQVIADLGCGMNQLKMLVKSYSQWYSFDHYSDDKTVIKADISNLKEYLSDNSIDAAVFCMSLWGINYMDYIKESYRYLKDGGIMYIAEPKDKINQAELIGGATQFGFNIISIDIERNGITYIEFKKFVK